MARTAVIVAGLFALLGAQAAFGWTTRHFLPHRDLLPPVPSPRMVALESFGDRQFLFRLDSLDMQNAGDTGGRIVPIKNYDFAVVVGWLRTLQNLDPLSSIPAGLAAGFYGQSQNLAYVPAIIQFIRENVALHPELRWRYLYNAIYLAQVRLHDQRLALNLAQQLASYDASIIPLWAATMPAFILELLADREGAHAQVEEARRRYAGRMTPEEEAWSFKYMNYLAGKGPRPR